MTWLSAILLVHFVGARLWLDITRCYLSNGLYIIFLFYCLSFIYSSLRVVEK